MGVGGATPSFSTPAMGGGAAMGGATPSFGTATPAGALARGLATPTPMAAGAMTPEQMQSWRWERELDERNRPLSDEELDALFPQEGYKVREKRQQTYSGPVVAITYLLPLLQTQLYIFCFLQILKPPSSYQPIRTPARKLTATPTPMGMSGFRFQMEEDKVRRKIL